VKDPIALISAKLNAFANGFFLQLPNIIAAIVVFAIAWFASRWIARGVARVVATRGRHDLGTLIGSMARGAILIAAGLTAAVIVFPSINPGDALATLGVGSVAIGFAFKDILQNLLAGILLLIQRPYRRGDQIQVQDYEGTIEHIMSRATLIKTYDGRRVVIPNSDLYTSPVVVNTAFETRRDDFLIGIGYGDKPSRAAELFLEAIKGVEGVLADPAPEVLPWALNDSTVDLKARWWANSLRTDQVHVRSRVVLAIHEVAVANGIDLPFPTQVLLFHDQTEETDGDRTRQREGWPAGKHPPKPRRLARSDEKPDESERQ
jgi:small conductance mechanosensitive channel